MRERYERREAVGYDIEGVSPGYDVYNRLRKNLEKDERNSEGTMVSIEIVSNAPQEEQEVDGLELLAGAAAYITRRGCTHRMTNAEESSPDVHGILSTLSSFIQPPKAKLIKRKPVRLINALPGHGKSPDTIRSITLNQLKFA